MAKDVGDERRTVILDKQPEEIKIEDLIENEKMIIIITTDGFAKRVNYNTFRTQGRGGKGVFTSDEENTISKFFIANTHDELLLFTKKGNYYRLNTLDIQQSNRQGKGVNLSKLLNISDDVITSAIINTVDNKREKFITTCTKQGYVKRTNIEEYKTKRKGGLSALKLEDGDELKWATVTYGDSEFLLSTKQGFSLRFKESAIRAIGKNSKGVPGIKLGTSDEIVSFIACDPKNNPEILTISEYGFSKRTNFDEFRLTARKGKGVKSMTLDNKTGSLVSTLSVEPDSKLMVLTKRGKTIKLEISTIRRSSRVTKGVKVINLSENDSIVDMIHVVKNLV